ncbi:MAG: N-acetylmuramoyl-L-alanine amidase [Bacteroidales bacterium]|nr:N-acetylmuramoyl-L-alanine amidase [Bacteroidales bacterium]
MKILTNNGHGIETKGKQSPNGRLLEYAQNRLLAGRIVSALQARGLDASLLVPEETDIPLPERCRRVNEWCRQLGKDNVLLISIHCNAAGNGDRWYNARGWSAYTSPGNTPADRLATCLYNAAQIHIPGHRLRMDTTDGDPDLEKAFYLLQHTPCPAVLTENMFMDNQADVDFLLSPEGQQALINLHVTGINFYLRLISG